MICPYGHCQVILWGGTGQAKVVRPILEYYGCKVVAVFDDTPNLPPPFPDIPLYEGKDFDSWVRGSHPSSLGFCLAIGNPHGRARLRIHDRLESRGLTPLTFTHPTAYIEPSATLGPGTQVMAHAYVGVGVRTGRQCILNTNSSVDHEDILEDGVEIAPGATLCGLVHMGAGSWACAGSTVLPRLKIGEDAIIGAGAVVLRDIPAKSKVVGVPARAMVERVV
jgi:sugar O-acyltransferase (sialic acid O-acetyltransferase NeuD family)